MSNAAQKVDTAKSAAARLTTSLTRKLAFLNADIVFLAAPFIVPHWDERWSKIKISPFQKLQLCNLALLLLYRFITKLQPLGLIFVHLAKSYSFLLLNLFKSPIKIVTFG